MNPVTAAELLGINPALEIPGPLYAFGDRQWYEPIGDEL